MIFYFFFFYNPQEQKRRAEEDALREILKNESTQERDRIMAHFNSQMRKLNNRMNDERSEMEDKVKAKFAAKKRLKEELEKEKAVTEELNRITKSHVRSPVFFVL